MKMGLRIGSEMPKLDHINWVSGYPEQQASKPYLVHFWTLDCSSCIELMPDVAALLKRYDGLIHTVSINLEGEDEDEVIAKAKKAGIEAPVESMRRRYCRMHSVIISSLRSIYSMQMAA